MPRPHIPHHISLRRAHSNTGSPNPASTPDGSRSTSPTRTNGFASGLAKTPGEQRGDPLNVGLSLRVEVVKARNLAAKDKSGTSDPFLVITLGDAKQATSVISRTLNPEWHQTFDFPVNTSDAALLEAVCWDKDRFSNDYMGEFDVILEELFHNGTTTPEPQWFKLESRRAGRKKKKKDANVSGEVMLKFTLYDPLQLGANSQQILQKFRGVVALTPDEDDEEDPLSRISTKASELDDVDEEDGEERERSDETDGVVTPGGLGEKQRRIRRRKIKKLKEKSRLKAYEFGAMSEVAGVLFIEINRITDLPPEKNMTRTTFDMDPFVVTSLGKKTYRTKVVNHNLNPVFDEKLVFQVQKHEVNYSLNFAVVDRDKFSGNDFVGTANFPIEKVTLLAPEPDPSTGLYPLPDIPDGGMSVAATEGERERRKRFRLPLSRSTSQNNLDKMSRSPSRSALSRATSHQDLNRLTQVTSNPGRPKLKHADSWSSVHEDQKRSPSQHRPGPTSAPSYVSTLSLDGVGHSSQSQYIESQEQPSEDLSLASFEIPLDLRRKDRWEAKHTPVLFIRAKYMPYQALRQQFWRAMLKQYDADESGEIDKIELTTMLDTLGSTLHSSTIDGFFKRFQRQHQGVEVLSMDQAVICLEEQLMKTSDFRKDNMHSPHWNMKVQSGTSTAKLNVPATSSADVSPGNTPAGTSPSANTSEPSTPFMTPNRGLPTLEVSNLDSPGERGEFLPDNDLADFDYGLDDETKEEHVVEIKECPICHQPRLTRSGKKGRSTDADIITHIATCASSDWRAVNNLVMAGFVTSSQAQRKWYSKVITKVSYGGYKLGANSANILVQDRRTGMINEERMSVYVRLGIRLLYKGLKSNSMEKKRAKKLLKSMSFKQGKKYDDPSSATQIQGFINFHQLDMTEVLRPTSEFKNFNQFFYRELKPGARPCSAPDNSNIIVSPADCRSVVFNRLEDAQKIWVKGRDFTVERLLGEAYPEDAKRYKNGALGIFRLAPQDYHRFHIPVDGVMGEPKLIEGEYYTVNPMAIRSALDVYGENVRVCVPIDSECHGRVMVICVGAMLVGSTVITRKTGEHVKRAEELGYFKFGGSTILLLFEPGKMVFDSDIIANANGALETLIRVGMSIGHSPDHPAWVPDMPKSNPSHEEKQEAKRRIGGSLDVSSGVPEAAQVA